MTWRQITLLLTALAIAAVIGIDIHGDTVSASAPLAIELQKVHMPHANLHNIKVPIHKRLLDVINDTGSRPMRSDKKKYYEIEMLDASSSISMLHVQEVTSMAITPQTTYNFKRELDIEALDFSVLANRSHEQMTIISVDKSSGRVRGLHREADGETRHVTNEDGDRLHVRSLQEIDDRKEWTCGAIGIGHSHGRGKKTATDLNSSVGGSAVRSNNLGRGGSNNDATMWREPQTHFFNVDISIQVDARFIEKQGSAEKAVEYINFLVSASNLIFEYEVNAHLNIIHIEETDQFDNQTNAKEALSLMRLGLRSNSTYYQDGSKFRLHHAVLGRYLGGGIAFIDSVCDKDWGFGVTSDITGNLNNVDSNVLFDFFIFTHEIGHSLGSGHTFDDEYDPPIDFCAPCASPGSNVTINGLPRNNSATLMSYCNFCDGGLSNIALTLGGEWKGLEPRKDLLTWENSPLIEGYISHEPRRVSHFIWETLSSKAPECIVAPLQLNEIQGCNVDSHCNDANPCTIDACQNGICKITETFPDCCGNRICELGELNNSCKDCGPFYIEPPMFCTDCFALDGFMIEIRLQEDAEKYIFINSISFMHAAPTEDDVVVSLYATLEGSYIGQDDSNSGWRLLSTSTLSTHSSSDFLEIIINPPLQMNPGSTKAFYLYSSHEVILFGQGVYSVQNEHGVELHSSRAVTGFFGDGIDGFSLSCFVQYSLNDLSTPSLLNFPSTESTDNKEETQNASRDKLSSHSSDDEITIDSSESKGKHVNLSSAVLQFVCISIIVILL